MNWTLLANSLAVSAAATAAALALGVIAALWALTLGEKLRLAVMAAAALTLALPSFLVTNTWLTLFGNAGLLRAFLPLNIYSLGGTAWILSLLAWPLAFFFALAAWSRLDSALLESDAKLRGWALLRHLLLPFARSSLVLAAALIFAVSFNNFAVPAILQTKVFPAELWVSFNTRLESGFAQAATLSWPLLLAPVPLLLLLRRHETSWPRFHLALNAGHLQRQLGGPGRWAAATVAISLLVLSFALPVGHLAGSARTWSEMPSALAASRDALWNSFALSASVAALCLGLGGWISKQALGAALWFPFLVPGIVLAIGLIFVFNRPAFAAFTQSAAFVALGLTLRYAVAGWAAWRNGAAAADPALVSGARIMGGSRWEVFRHALWPQMGPRLLGAAYVTYLLCLWDVETLIQIIPPGRETLAMRVFNLLHYGHNSQVNALCLLLLGLAAWPLAAWALLKAGKRMRAGAAVLACAIACGCSPPPANEARLDSRFFSRVQIIGERGAGAGQLNKPRSLTVDREDNLYVVDMTGRVQKFSPEGKYLLSWQMPETDLGKAKGMCLDSDGNIVVVEPHYCRVNHYDTQGRLVSQWGQRGTNTGQLTLPRCAAVNSLGEIYLSEYTVVDRVQGFSKDHQPLVLFGHPGPAPGQFNRAEGIGIGRDDRVHVADSCNHRIQIFSPEGKLISAYGHSGGKEGELSYPYDVQVDASGLQFVCEFGNSRIQIFDAANQSVEIIGRAGSAPGEFANPWAVALDSQGNLYVADSRNHRVQKLIRRPETRPAPSA